MRSAALLSEFGLGHAHEYAPFILILSALHLIALAKSHHIWQMCENGTSCDILK